MKRGNRHVLKSNVNKYGWSGLVSKSAKQCGSLFPLLIAPDQGDYNAEVEHYTYRQVPVTNCTDQRLPNLCYSYVKRLKD